MPLEQRYARHQLLADQRMLAQHAALVRRERFALVEDLVWDSDFADVVQQEAVLEARALEQARIELAGQLLGVADDSPRVLGGAEVLRGQGACERVDRLHVGDLDEVTLPALELEQSAQIARVEEE